MGSISNNPSMVSESNFLVILLITLSSVSRSKGWRAVPANQAVYSHRRQLVLSDDSHVISDELLPRTSIHSTYKFGFCRKDATASVFLRKKSMIHFPDWQSSHADYVYLIELKHTQRLRLQCVVLRIMVPLKYLFRRSRLPMYYCQGRAYYVLFDFIQVLELHEFFLHHHLNMPADFYFEFYHPEAL